MKRTLLAVLLSIAAAHANAAVIAYMSGPNEPWDYVPPTNPSNMDAAFGAGNWDRIQFGSNYASYDTLYVDGGDGNSDAFFAWVSANLGALESYVNSGGELFLNAAGWSLPGAYTMPFGSILTESAFSSIGTAIDPTHELFTNAGTSWSGSAFAHDTVSGAGLTDFITGDQGTILAGGKFGSGYYMLGGQTSTYFHSPVGGSNPFQLRVNELQFVARQSSQVPEPTTLALLGLGMTGLAFVRRRRNAAC